MRTSATTSRSASCRLVPSSGSVRSIIFTATDLPLRCCVHLRTCEKRPRPSISATVYSAVNEVIRTDFGTSSPLPPALALEAAAAAAFGGAAAGGSPAGLSISCT